MVKKIMIVPDVQGWAIDQLTQVIIRHNQHLDFKCYYLHPRDVSAKIEDFKREVEEFKPDLIHFQYFRSCSQALALWPELKEYKILLTHHNQRTKALYEAEWGKIGVDHIVTHTRKCRALLAEHGEDPNKISIIQHGIDLDFFSFSGNEPIDKMVGYVGRVVPWKGLYDILKAGDELGYPVQIMGKLDKPDYWSKCLEFEKTMDFSFFDCKDVDRIDAYRHMTIYVGNSIDGYEEGPLGLLEAWATGVPVITTNTGEAADLAVHEQNALVVDFENYEQLRDSMKRLLEDEELRKKLRNNGWNTVKNMCEEKMAREYSDLYYNLMTDEAQPLVSVVIPATYTNDIDKILDRLKEQTYKNFEVILCWDEVERYDSEYNYPFPIKELFTQQEGYNLAMARNLGIVEAQGEYIMFNDARMAPDQLALQIFVDKAKETKDKVWFFGDKGAQKKSFVENFSFVRRDDIINFGLMNERMDRYGGMSQEIRTRWSQQGGIFEYVDEAKAEQIKGSKMTDERRKDIIASKLKLFKMYKNVSF